MQTALVENAALMVNRLNQQVWGETPSNPLPSPPPNTGEGARTSSPAPFSIHSDGEEKADEVPPLEIDTAGLIADLFKDAITKPPQAMSKGADAREIETPLPKPRKRRGRNDQT